MRAWNVRRLVVFAALGAAGFAPAAFAGDMQVLESNVPSYAVGMILQEAKTLDLPPGGRVKVMRRPSNETQVFARPDPGAKRQPDDTGGARSGQPAEK